jgi:hypothetical protein
LSVIAFWVWFRPLERRVAAEPAAVAVPAG